MNEESLKLLQKHHDALRKQFDYTTEEYFKLQMTNKEQEARISNSIGKDESERIQKAHKHCEIELTETRAALLSYKSMQGVITEQVKSLKIMHERRKDENESLISTLRDVQSESFDK